MCDYPQGDLLVPGLKTFTWHGRSSTAAKRPLQAPSTLVWHERASHLYLFTSSGRKTSRIVAVWQYTECWCRKIAFSRNVLTVKEEAQVSWIIICILDHESYETGLYQWGSTVVCEYDICKTHVNNKTFAHKLLSSTKYLCPLYNFDTVYRVMQSFWCEVSEP